MYSWQFRQGGPLQSQGNAAESNNRWTVPLLSAQAEIPEALSNWLGRLCLLYGVPFSYLVPDEGMLPAESIRFFHIDPNWIRVMLDGAASVGRVTTHDLEHDQQFQDILYSLAMRESPAGAGETRPQVAEGEAEPECRTGMLLRSGLVTHWPGLQVRAFAHKQSTQGETELPVLRMERLSSDTLLCIFAGVFQRLEIHQPPESVHFGADREEAGYMVELRTLGNAPGELIPGRRAVVPMRAGADGVVDVERLAGLLKDQLTQATGFAGDFTSAEFAVQMIEGVDRCVFENNE